MIALRCSSWAILEMARQIQTWFDDDDDDD